MRKLIVIGIMASMAAIITLSFRPETVNKNNNYPALPRDSVGSVKAFMSVYKVLKSARCMNCHPSGEAPLQGDDNHIHTMNVKRGVDGKGLYSVRCSNCHQAENKAGVDIARRKPKWGLPPANM